MVTLEPDRHPADAEYFSSVGVSSGKVTQSGICDPNRHMGC
jgi:hypothetical protein